MDKENILTLNLIEEHFSKIEYSRLPNPIYGKNIFFFEGCAGPRTERNQLLGYLGAFSGGTKKLNSEIDIGVFPLSSYRNLENGDSDEVLNMITKKMNKYNEETERYTNSISNTLIVSEHQLFQFIKDNLLLEDRVRMEQFNRINFKYEF